MFIISSDITESYLWIVIVGGLFGFFAAMGIGANDVANAFTAANTFTETTFIEPSETVHELVDLDIDPAHGSKQYKTLTAAPVFTSSITDGQSVRLRIVGGDTHAVTWPTATWVTSAGNVLPTATADDVFVIEMEGSTLYIYYLGSAV